MPKHDQVAFSCPVCKWVIVTHQAVVIGVTHQGQTTGPVDRESELRILFSTYDEDDTGDINMDELGHLLANLNFPAPGELSDLFHAADENRDGVLDWSEFMTFYNELQTKMLRSSVVADIRMTEHVIREAETAVSRDQQRVAQAQKTLKQAGRTTGHGEQRELTLEERAKALQKMSNDLKNASANLNDAQRAERESSEKSLQRRLAQRKEKLLIPAKQFTPQTG